LLTHQERTAETAVLFRVTHQTKVGGRFGRGGHVKLGGGFRPGP
jgi:hypothetical protein